MTRTFSFVSLAVLACLLTAALASPLPVLGGTPEEKQYRSIEKEAIPMIHKAVNLQSEVLEHAIKIKSQGLPLIHEERVNIGGLYDNRGYVESVTKMNSHKGRVTDKVVEARNNWEALRTANSKKVASAIRLHEKLMATDEILRVPASDPSGKAHVLAMSRGQAATNTDRDVSHLVHHKKVVEEVRSSVAKKNLSRFLPSNWHKGQSSS